METLRGPCTNAVLARRRMEGSKSTMTSELACKTLNNLSRVDAIRAIQQAYLQLKALDDNVDCEHFDQQPALKALRNCLIQAEHMGYTEEERR